jgi:hypothetical protein
MDLQTCLLMSKLLQIVRAQPMLQQLQQMRPPICEMDFQKAQASPTNLALFNYSKCSRDYIRNKILQKAEIHSCITGWEQGVGQYLREQKR